MRNLRRSESELSAGVVFVAWRLWATSLKEMCLCTEYTVSVIYFRKWARGMWPGSWYLVPPRPLFQRRSAVTCHPVQMENKYRRHISDRFEVLSFLFCRSVRLSHRPCHYRHWFATYAGGKICSPRWGAFDGIHSGRNLFRVFRSDA